MSEFILDLDALPACSDDPEEEVVPCVICSCLIGDEVGYGDDWGEGPICGQCAGGEVDATQTARQCRLCGCTDTNCQGCVERTGEPCYWVEDDLCSACEPRVLIYSEAEANAFLGARP